MELNEILSHNVTQLKRFKDKVDSLSNAIEILEDNILTELNNSGRVFPEGVSELNFGEGADSIYILAWNGRVIEVKIDRNE